MSPTCVLRPAVGITVEVILPRLDKDGQEVLGRPFQTEFKDSTEFMAWLNIRELQGLEDRDGTPVDKFHQLKAGCRYTGVLRPSSGVLRSLRGAERSRINAAEQEFGEGLIPLVAEEEGVSIAQVTLVSGLASAALSPVSGEQYACESVYTQV